jgi:hypothetical protein
MSHSTDIKAQLKHKAIVWHKQDVDDSSLNADVIMLRSKARRQAVEKLLPLLLEAVECLESMTKPNENFDLSWSVDCQEADEFKRCLGLARAFINRLKGGGV